MSDAQWARLVVQFWLVDEAAVGVESRSSSTNGAMGSDEIWHSDKVLVEDFPLRRRRELDSGDESSDILEPRKKARISLTIDCV